MNKKILGLDLGTNSIGWALVEQDIENKEGKILGMGSRIIPMTQDIKDEFGKGNSISQTADRTNFRSIRRLRERYLLRRERLHRVLNILGFLPKHYANEIDFQNRLGKFKKETEPKLAWILNDKQKFEFIFQQSFLEMAKEFNGLKIPYDWTIYYLRKKALTKKIEIEEIAWIILNFNQKRGYYQLRGEEEEENTSKLVEFYSLKIVDVIPDEEKNNKGETWYSLHLENGWIYRRSSKIPLDDWKDKTRDFIVTTDLNEDKTPKIDKDGKVKRSFRAPSEDDWTLIKKKTEQEISNTNKTVGTYIYDALLKNPTQKINGKLVRTIERKFYKDELIAILKKQIELQPEIFTDDLYNDCVRELYKTNESHQITLSKRDFIHLFIDDIIFYQRPLKSKKYSISNCSLEYKIFKIKDKDGKELQKTEYRKAIPKSHPLYQEFRVWQWLSNLRIYKKEDDSDVTNQFITSIEDNELLFDFLMSKKEVNHKDILEYFLEKKEFKGKALNSEVSKYRWNYVFDDSKDKENDKSKLYPCNETWHEINKRLAKVENIAAFILSKEIEIQLWHIIYSVTDKIDFEKALKSFAIKHQLDINSFVDNLKKIPPFKSEYGAFSEKAIKKLLPIMRIGKHWSWESIDNNTKNRINKILNAEFDEEIRNQVREKSIHLTTNNDFQGLPLWLAQYIVYDRHSEASNIDRWKSVEDLEKYLTKFKQHSLRNPIVEQIITETLRVVKDIWTQFGNGANSFFDEIHIELGREMKNTAEERKRLTSLVSDNEATNLRIKALLAELLNDSQVENVRPYSPLQQEALKIYEDGVLSKYTEQELKNEKLDGTSKTVYDISSSAQPSKNELQRYKLWLEQKYRSPYTGEIIPLNKLFTSEYEIEHIIPQSRYFDDSFSNKVICEAAVNKLKDKQLGLEFIKNHHGSIIEIGFGRNVKIFDNEAYQKFVKEHYAQNRSKKNRLLLEEIPEKMIERQLNDTRYISKFITGVLSNIVRSSSKDDGVNSKNIIPGNGKITSILKQDWGLNDVWNDLMLPRFERMNQITNSTAFTVWNQNHQKLLPTIPLEYSKGFQKKRIDHRHHALDALIIACATRDHINLLNNQYAKSDNSRYDLQNKLRNKEKWRDKDGKERDKFTEFKKPWKDFTSDAKNELGEIVVSFKQNLRVINKTTNRYETFKDENGNIRLGKDGKPKKGFIPQTKGDSWAIRKPMHKDTVSGLINLPRIKVAKGKILTATRKSIDTSFDLKMIESITDTGIQKILKNYLAYKENNPELAFSPEGLEDMNKNIEQYNDGKDHEPIYKARIFEMGSKFTLGYTGNKKNKYVEAAKGTNLFFAIYEDKNGKRNYDTIPLNIVIERQKQELTPVPEKDEKGNNLLFHLSPNDLVYVPSGDEIENINRLNLNEISKEQANNIYKMVSSTGSECHFTNSNIASLIKSYDAKSKIGELGSLNKLETTTDNLIRIKEKCIKLKVDRLGNISKA